MKSCSYCCSLTAVEPASVSGCGTVFRVIVPLLFAERGVFDSQCRRLLNVSCAQPSGTGLCHSFGGKECVCSMLRSVRGGSRSGGTVESYALRAGRTSRQGEGVAIVRKLIDSFRGVLACSDGCEQGPGR
jgi:hypothetical protein